MSLRGSAVCDSARRLVVRPTDDVESRSGVDVEVVRSLVRTAQEQARDLSQELRDLPSRYSAQWQVDAAPGYATAAANAYGAFLQQGGRDRAAGPP